MIVIFYAELICGDAYRLVVTSFEVLGYGIAALSIGHGKSLTEEKKGSPLFRISG